MNTASQTCQDESGLLKALNTDNKKNEKLAVQKTSTIVKRMQCFEKNNIASEIGVRIECKFESKNVINLSRRNLSSSEISLLSKFLKIVPTANKKNHAKLKAELEEYGKKLRVT